MILIIIEAMRSIHYNSLHLNYYIVRGWQFFNIVSLQQPILIQ